jgi:hypothetical protein
VSAGVTPEALAEAQRKARDYLYANGTSAPLPSLRKRVGQAFERLESFLESVDAGRAARVAWAGEWSLHEIADHVVETHRPSLEELRSLLAGRRPAGGPVPAALQSAAPLARAYATVLGEMKNIHAGVVAALDATRDDFTTEARAPIVMVANATDPTGATVPVHWVEEFDWKAYAAVLRLHAIDHLHQAKKVLAAL